MRLLNLLVSPFILLILTHATSAFVVDVWGSKDCFDDFRGEFDLPSDGSCHKLEKGAYSFMFHSRIGCTFSTWEDGECKVKKYETKAQNKCYTPGYEADAVMCWKRDNAFN